MKPKSGLRGKAKVKRARGHGTPAQWLTPSLLEEGEAQTGMRLRTRQIDRVAEEVRRLAPAMIERHRTQFLFAPTVHRFLMDKVPAFAKDGERPLKSSTTVGCALGRMGLGLQWVAFGARKAFDLGGIDCGAEERRARAEEASRHRKWLRVA